MSYRDEVMALNVHQGEMFAYTMQHRAAEIAARADARIAELVELLTECRDCVADCLNAEQNQRHSRAERADYYAGLLAQVDAARAGGGESGDRPT